MVKRACYMLHVPVPEMDHSKVTMESTSSSESIDVGSEPSPMSLRTRPTHWRRSRTRHVFNEKERIDMVNFVIQTKAFSQLKGRLLWQKMSLKFPNHTWESLKEHFRKKIMPRIELFELSKEDVKRIRDGMSVQARHRKSYSVSEDEAIVKYVLKHPESSVMSNTFWIKFQKSSSRIKGRTWEAVKARYLKHLRKDVSTGSAALPIRDRRIPRVTESKLNVSIDNEGQFNKDADKNADITPETKFEDCSQDFSLCSVMRQEDIDVVLSIPSQDPNNIKNTQADESSAVIQDDITLFNIPGAETNKLLSEDLICNLSFPFEFPADFSTPEEATLKERTQSSEDLFSGREGEDLELFENVHKENSEIETDIISFTQSAAILMKEEHADLSGFIPPPSPIPAKEDFSGLECHNLSVETEVQTDQLLPSGFIPPPSPKPVNEDCLHLPPENCRTKRKICCIS